MAVPHSTVQVYYYSISLMAVPHSTVQVYYYFYFFK
jgi:hypothetical protein